MKVYEYFITHFWGAGQEGRHGGPEFNARINIDMMVFFFLLAPIIVLTLIVTKMGLLVFVTLPLSLWGISRFQKRFIFTRSRMNKCKAQYLSEPRWRQVLGIIVCYSVLFTMMMSPIWQFFLYSIYIKYFV